MRLSAHDASFLYGETASGPMHSVVFSILDGSVSRDQYLKFYADRLHLVPRLRQKLAFVPFNLAHPRWIDDQDFDLGNHIRGHEVSANTKLDRAIEIGLELGEPLLDRARPLWLHYVIENVEGKTLIVQMGHHAFMDGATAVAMSTVLTDPEPDTEAPEAPEKWRPESAPSSFELWQEAATENAQSGFGQVQQLAEGAQSLVSLGSKGASLLQRMSKPVLQAPWNASLVGPKRSMARFDLKLSKFKPVRTALGGTLNDIAVTIVAEAAARYLAKKKEEVDDQYLRLMCPVNVRGEDDDPLAMGGNRVSAMFPLVKAEPMPIDERYELVRTELGDIKNRDEASILDQMQQLQPNVPPIAMAQTLSVGTQWDPTVAAARAPLPVVPGLEGSRPQQLGFNFTCTNVPGPNWKQYIAGCRVENSFGTLMLGGNLGFGASVGSYNGRLNFVFTADPRLMSDVEMFRDLASQALDELRTHAEDAQ
ncbi:MAG: DUF1298 domain-containing protein [Pseudomonadales bacterium]|nr:DUF1298 domain-containing protein [Pseudomonadales bacterium]